EKQFLRRERPVAVAERLKREEVITEPSPIREFVNQARTAAGLFRDDIVPGGAPVPEADVVAEQATFIEKIKTEFYPGRENEVEVDFNDATDQLIFTLNGVPQGFALPSTLAEQVHGQDIAENYALQGPSALPEDSPLHKPGLSEGTLKILSNTAELFSGPATEVLKGIGDVATREISEEERKLLISSSPFGSFFFGGGRLGEKPPEGPITPLEALERVDEPRLLVKEKVIEPILPEFEFTFAIPQELREAAPFVLPPLAIAHVSIMALNLIAGTNIPDIADLLPEKITLTDEVTAEIMSFVLDPLNLLPGIGFGPEILKATRLAATGGRRAILKLARSPKFLSAMDDGLRLVKAESGILSTGGRRAQLEARLSVGDDIARGVETADPALVPVREEIDTLVDKATGATDFGQFNREVRTLVQEATEPAFRGDVVFP
ncbi:hypothetical protein LCGC14_2698240, partial [marine sediment metagenome]